MHYNREYFVHPLVKLRLHSNVILKIIKLLYRVSKSGNYWFNTYYSYHYEKLLMK